MVLLVTSGNFQSPSHIHISSCGLWNHWGHIMSTEISSAHNSLGKFIGCMVSYIASLAQMSTLCHRLNVAESPCAILNTSHHLILVKFPFHHHNNPDPMISKETLLRGKWGCDLNPQFRHMCSFRCHLMIFSSCGYIWFITHTCLWALEMPVSVLGGSWYLDFQDNCLNM